MVKESEKFLRFKVELESLCIAHEVVLASEMYDALEVWDRHKDEYVFHSRLVDQTRKAPDHDSKSLNETKPDPIGADTLPDYRDPRVKLVYDLLCEHDVTGKPEGDHWEGWIARRIVAALASAAPAGQPGAAYADPYGWDCAGTLVRTRNTMESYRADGVVPIPLFADSGASRGQAPAPTAVAEPAAWLPAPSAQGEALTDSYVQPSPTAQAAQSVGRDAAAKAVAWARPVYATEPVEPFDKGDLVDIEFYNRAEKPEGEGWRPLVFAYTGDAARAAKEVDKTMSEFVFQVGDKVEKFKGDYHWKGTVVSAFKTENNLIRYVVSHPADEGYVLHIYNEAILRKV